jgi:hypothetical protein
LQFFLSRAQKIAGIPGFSFLERSYPETMIAGKIIIQYKNDFSPLVNEGGHILGIPIENAEAIDTIESVSEKKKKCTDNRKQRNFLRAWRPAKNSADRNLSAYDCFLYIGGYSNRASALVKTLAVSGFSFTTLATLILTGFLFYSTFRILQKNRLFRCVWTPELLMNNRTGRGL